MKVVLNFLLFVVFVSAQTELTFDCSSPHRTCNLLSDCWSLTSGNTGGGVCSFYCSDIVLSTTGQRPVTSSSSGRAFGSTVTSGIITESCRVLREGETERIPSTTVDSVIIQDMTDFVTTPTNPAPPTRIYDSNDFKACGWPTNPWDPEYHTSASGSAATRNRLVGLGHCALLGQLVFREPLFSMTGDARTLDAYREGCLGRAASTAITDLLPRFGLNVGPTTFGTALTSAYSGTFIINGVCKASAFSRYSSENNIMQQSAGITWTIRGSSNAEDMLIFFPNSEDPEYSNTDFNRPSGTGRFPSIPADVATNGATNLDIIITTGILNAPTSTNFRDIFWTINRDSFANAKPLLTVSDLSFIEATQDTRDSSRTFQGTLFFVGDGDLRMTNVNFQGFDNTGHYGSDGPNKDGTQISPTIIQSGCSVQPSSVDSAAASCLLSPINKTRAQRPSVTLTNVLVESRPSTSTIPYIYANGVRRATRVNPVVNFDTQTRQRHLFASTDFSVWTVTNLRVTDQRFNDQNGGVLFASESEISIASSSFVGNRVWNSDISPILGGLFHFRRTSNVTFVDSVFTNNEGLLAAAGTQPMHGLCIYQEDTSFEAENYQSSGLYRNITFTNNTHAGDGVGFYFWGTDIAVNLTNNVFVDNTATRPNFNTAVSDNSNAKGGCIYTRDLIDANIQTATTSTFSGNRADHGGCLYFQQSKLVLSFDPTQVSFSGNKVYRENDLFPTRAANRGRGGGGAIAVDQSEITITGAQFVDNSAEYGGAVEARNSVVRFGNTVFTRNSALFFTNYTREMHGAGGAIRSMNSILQCDQCTFSGNWAHNGGSIFAFRSFVSSGVSPISGDSNPSVTLARSTFQPGAASGTNPGFGRAVYEGGALYISSVDLFVKDSVFNGHVSKKGGAVRIADSVDPSSSAQHVAEFVKTTFTLNRAEGTVAPSNPLPNINTDFAGGAIATDRSVSIVGCTFSSNVVSLGPGGALATWRGAIISDSFFMNNTATANRGGAIWSTPIATEPLSLVDSDFTSNGAGVGGAVYSSNPLTSIDRCSFRANLARLTASPPAGDGGAVALFNRATIKGSRFVANTAQNGGGAVWTNSQLIVSQESTFESNTITSTTGVGAGIKCVSDPLNLATGASTIVDNRLSLTDATFTSNTASNGAAVWSSCDNWYNRVHVNSNTASLASGGALYCHNENRRLSGCAFHIQASSFMSNSPSSIRLSSLPSSSLISELHIMGSTFTGPTRPSSGIIVENTKFRIYSAAASAGMTSTFVGTQITATGPLTTLTLDGVRMVSSDITASGIAIARLGSLAADAASNLAISGVADASTIGTTNVGGLSLANGANCLKLGGAIWLSASGTVSSSICGNHNITLTAGTLQWTAGSLGASGDSSYINVMTGATFEIASSLSQTLWKSIKNWGTLRFLKAALSDPGVLIAGGVNIQNAVSGTIDFTNNMIIRGPSDLATGATLHNWGKINVNENALVNIATILYGQSMLEFTIFDENNFGTLSFGGYVQFNGGIRATDVRNFLLEGIDGPTATWMWSRDFGTAYPLIRLRSSYVQRLHNRFRPRKVHYVRGGTSFPIAGTLEQPPYLRYGPSPNRSVIFLVNPASFMTVTPIVMLVALLFSLL